MVAITVILAAVIGAFVLEIGDQQETAPSTSFDTEQETRYYEDLGSNKGQRNLTVVSITHAGGDTLDISQNRLSIGGNTSVWRIESNSGWDEVYPVPNVWEARGSNDRVEFSSGESWDATLYSCNSCDKDPMPSLENSDPSNGNCCSYWIGGDDGYGSGTDPVEISVWNGGGTPRYDTNPIEQNDDVRVIWTASSGGKTQALFRYTVQ
jgi:hypothetical protein